MIPESSDGFCTFQSSSFFLKECLALQAFCDKIKTEGILPIDGSARHFVVCERKEDLVAVRAQISWQLSHQEKPQVLGGVSMYTLDALSAQMMAQWASFENTARANPTLESSTHESASYKSATHESATHKSVTHEGATQNRSTQDCNAFAFQTEFSKPFLDVVTQENILRMILLRLRFPAKESLSVAKQILLLLDTPLPEGTHLLGLLLESESKSRFQKTLTSQSLKQVLSAFQMAQFVFGQFSRSQSFALEQSPEIMSLLKTNLEMRSLLLTHLSPKFLRANLLWIEAPKYIAHQELQPGNFQPHISRQIKETLFLCRRLAQENTDTKPMTLSAQYIIRIKQDQPLGSLTHVEAQVVSPERRLWEKAQRAAVNQDCVVLGDFETKETLFESLGPLGIPFHADDVECATVPEFKHKKMQSLWEEALDFCELIDDCVPKPETFTSLYALDWLNPEKSRSHRKELLLSICFQESAQSNDSSAESTSEIAQLPKALSLLACKTLPTSIQVLGRPHSPKSPSFNVKRLNDVIHRLAREGVEIEVPASDISYSGFYSWLVKRGVPVTFWVMSLEDIEGFPATLSRQRGLQVTQDQMLPSWGTLQPFPDLINTTHEQSGFSPLCFRDPEWWNRLHPERPAPTMAATQFEGYVKCPFRFYLNTVCRIDDFTSSTLEANPLEAGTAVHKMAECLVTALKLYLERGGKENGIKLLEAILHHFQNVDRVVFDDLAKMKVFFHSLAEDPLTQLLLGEIAESLGDCPDPGELQQALQVQLVRRAFLRLVQTESRRLADRDLSATGSLGGFLETAFQIQSAEGMEIRGKWDRIDFVNTEKGVAAEIIDYKTSVIPKKERVLCLFPSQFQDPNKSRLSVQGALYAKAWMERPDSPPCHSFVLYRLKSLDLESDPFLAYTFGSDPGEFLNAFDDQYGPLLAALFKGEFPAAPYHTSHCGGCPALSFCPVGLGENSGLTEQEKDEGAEA